MERPAGQEPIVSPAKSDAIHRALLSGLLANVGAKAEAHECTGTRGSKFSIFPASALFKRTPGWIMTAELVETTRLYARTVAPIQPDWIERVGSHLVKRLYTDPKWDKDRAQVVSTEKVSLYSLVLVPARRVNYGPIDPRTSREVFIQYALVEGQLRTETPFLRHNLALRASVERMEAKLRRRGMLAEARERFRFFDARLPQDIYDGQRFERWRHRAEHRNQRLLFLSIKEMLARGEVPPAIQQYPDQLQTDGLSLPLDYIYDADHPADGATVTIPLEALGQVPAERMGWLVPGWLTEKIEALIRSLPKELRKNFIPIADTAREAAGTLTFGEGSLRDALSLFLGKRAGIHIPVDAYDISTLPPWLRMNFRIVDAAGKQMMSGRDLRRIRADLRVEVQSSFAKLPPSEHNRDGLTRWDFGDLPERVPVHRHGMTLWGYPSLIDKGDSVSIRLLDSPEASGFATRAGARRLFMIQLHHEIQHLSRTFPNIEQMCLHFATIGNCAQLKQELLTASVDAAMFPDGQPVRTQAEFIARAAEGWRRLAPVASEMTELAGQILAEYHAVQLELFRDYPPLVADSIHDMREQLANLVYKNAFTDTPYQWLKHLPRYLRAISIRLGKLMNAGLARDAQAMAEIRPLWEQFKQRVEAHRRQGRNDPNLEQLRWMLEELRVSLFAQELKAAMPVSVQRLTRLLEQVAL